MSYTETGFAPDATVDLQTGDVIVPPGPEPMIQINELDGGYALAVLSLAMDPEGHNMAERCKVRTILSETTEGLGGQIATTLVAEYGLTPEEAEALVPPELQTAAMRQAAEERAKARGALPEHERARDEHGRFVAQEATWTEPAREA